VQKQARANIPQYDSSWLGLVSSLLYATRSTLVLNLSAFESKKYAAYDRFYGNGPYGEILTKKGPIRRLGFALPYNRIIYKTPQK